MQGSAKQWWSSVGFLVMILSLVLPVTVWAAVGEPGHQDQEPKQQQVIKTTAPAAESSMDHQTETREPAAQAGSVAVVDDGPNQIFLGSITGIILISIIWASLIKKRQGKEGNSFEPTA